VYEFCFEDGNGYAKTDCSGLDCPEQFLWSADISLIGKGGCGQGEIFHLRKHQSSGDPEVEGRNIDKEEQRRAGGALRGPKVDRGWGARCALETQCPATLTQDAGDPGDQVMGDPAFPEDAGRRVGVDVVKAWFDVRKEGGASAGFLSRS